MDKRFILKTSDKKYVVYATDSETAKQKLKVKINPDRVVKVADADYYVDEKKLASLSNYLSKSGQLLKDYRYEYITKSSFDVNKLKQEIERIVDTINNFKNSIIR